MQNYFLNLRDSQGSTFFPTQGRTLGGAGFTLVEALVAITILVIAVVGPLSIVAQSIQTANIAKDEVTAFYLAQEGIEFIRNKRDSNYLASTPTDWLQGLDACKVGNFCTVDAVSGSIVTCYSPSSPSPGCQDQAHKLNKVTSNGSVQYGYAASGYVPTNFTRTVSVRINGNNQEALISVYMKWKTGNVEKDFNLSERIFNWW